MSAPFNVTYADGGPPITGDGLNTFMQNCASVSEARSFIGTFGMAMFLQGTASAGDGGQGIFVWNATGTANDDNGVTTIVPFGSAPGSGEWTRLTADPGSRGQTPGTTTNDNALPGNVGEYIKSTVEQNAPKPLPGSGIITTVTSILLSPGDWDVDGVVGFNPPANPPQITYGIQAGINPVGAGLPDIANGGIFSLFVDLATGFTSIPTLGLNTTRISIAVPTVVYLVGQAFYNTGPQTGAIFGSIYGRRMR